MPLKQKFRSMINNILEDRHNHAGHNIMITADELKPTNFERLVLNQPKPSNQHVEEHIVSEIKLPGARNGVYRPSSRIERLAKPLVRRHKPLIRLSAVYRKVDYQIPWCKKGPNAISDKVQVIHPPPQPKRTKTGVSRAALKYEASENIKRLAKPRPILKADDEKKCFSVKPLSLTYKPSLRIYQLSKPRIRTTNLVL